VKVGEDAGYKQTRPGLSRFQDGTTGLLLAEKGSGKSMSKSFKLVRTALVMGPNSQKAYDWLYTLMLIDKFTTINSLLVVNMATGFF
jgi:hypothetical protein